MRKNIKDMDDPKFWLQQGQKQENLDNLDSASDFYRQGLRRNPTSLSLIYKLASAFTMLGLLRNALKWFEFGTALHPKWVDGLACQSMIHSMLFNSVKMLELINLAKDNYSSQQQHYDFREDQKNSQPHLISEERVIEILCFALRANHNY